MTLNNSSAWQYKEFLDEKAAQYNRPDFIQTDPIRVPHAFTRKEDIEIAAFLTAAIAWGKRSSIISNSFRLIELMDNKPYRFVMDFTSSELEILFPFVHRTFNGIDCIYFVKALQHIYRDEGGMESVFRKGYEEEKSVFSALRYFRTVFFEFEHPGRTAKHISDVTTNAAAKRLNMFLRWMVRSDKGGVDFGLWKGIPMADLMLPLDVHTGNTARKLGLLKRKQNDWKAVEEISAVLRQLNPEDPVKYDYALFGLGVFEKF